MFKLMKFLPENSTILSNFISLKHFKSTPEGPFVSSSEVKRLLRGQ